MSTLQKAKSFILDTLFPMSCLSCGYDGVWLCDPCLKKMRVFSFQVCPRCEKIIIESGKLCQNCKIIIREDRDFFLDALIAATKYKENNLSKIVHVYKYNLVQDLSAPLGKIMIKAFLDNGLLLPDAIIPVPLHKRRERSRGFNQSKLLANYISENLTPGLIIPVLSDLLIRKRHTTPQMKVKKYSERRKNIQGAFEIKGSTLADAKVEPLLKNLKILLIDDIATTGATLNECARILKENGAKKVFALVLARQEISKKIK